MIIYDYSGYGNVIDVIAIFAICSILFFAYKIIREG